MNFEFEDKSLKLLEDKVRSEERLSFEDGVTFVEFVRSFRCWLLIKYC